ncbi:hypothetical protein N7492_001773 [Penicillium capsulatum]|uniref:DNA polymerase delta subunit 4 n=1 Tax=Penicillium capsulatum TaxID=69766 RepID=A0A9W9IU94_9EURO|nr:hypothetical protein N7492_001773 [Penicillium capsulatum]
MPPRRRTAATQSTLAFGNQARVTKPSSTATPIHPAKHADKSASGTPEPQQVLASQPSNPHVAELAVRQQAKREQTEPQSEEDARASKLQYKDLQRYWDKEEKSRRFPRIHQADLDLEEKILRHFDLSSQYGPCIGIARLKRWRRANMLKLNPPLEVLAILINGKEDVKQRAHMDELLS